MIGRLHHIVLDSREPRQSAQFWSRLLGLPIIADEPDRVVVASSRDAGGITFIRRPGQPGRGARRAEEEGIGPHEVILEVLVADLDSAIDEVWRQGCHAYAGPGAAEEHDLYVDPDGHLFRLITRQPGTPRGRTWRRYVAIGDSSTEGLVDAGDDGQWIGWADRFAAHLATHQAEPLEYANLAVSGYRMHDIARSQLQAALDFEPDLMTIVGGVNDVIGLRPDFDRIEADLALMFSSATARGIEVLTFTNPDLAKANPVAAVVRERLLTLNAIIRRLAREHGVHFIDFEHVPMASDPRLWGEDRLHVNTIGHLRIAAGLAWLVGVPGFDRSWATPVDAQPGETPDDATDSPSTGARSHVNWALKHFGPWVVSGIRGNSYRTGAECKRPIPTVVEVEQLQTR